MSFALSRSVLETAPGSSFFGVIWPARTSFHPGDQPYSVVWDRLHPAFFESSWRSVHGGRFHRTETLFRERSRDADGVS